MLLMFPITKAVCLVIEQKLEVNILNDAITNYGTSKVSCFQVKLCTLISFKCSFTLLLVT